MALGRLLLAAARGGGRAQWAVENLGGVRPRPPPPAPPPCRALAGGAGRGGAGASGGCLGSGPGPGPAASAGPRRPRLPGAGPAARAPTFAAGALPPGGGGGGGGRGRGLGAKAYSTGYKMKSYSSLKGRFKRLASGKYKRFKAGLSHMNRKKSSKRKRNLRQPTILYKPYAKTLKKLGFGA